MVLSALASEGVVRVRVEDYEKLLASMLDEAEARVAAATEEARAAKEESASLRARLDEAEAREAESLARFQSWRDALVDTAADELAAESASWRAVVASRDEEIVALNALASELDAAAAQAAEREAHHIARANALEARIAAWESAGARVEDGTASVDATRGDRAANGSDAAAASDAAASDAAGRSIPSTPTASPYRTRHGRTRSQSYAAPVAVSPSPGDEEREAAKAAAARRIAAAAEAAGGGQDGDGTREAEETPATSWSWPFA
jgi:colicin import membrane protein